jgi:hypothetical protein
MIHVVDMYPTIAALAGASTAKAKPLDGLNMWPTLSEGKPSPRTELIYNVEPFRAGVREGDEKLIWRTPLPSAAALYNIPQDPSEKSNLAMIEDKRERVVGVSGFELPTSWIPTKGSTSEVRKPEASFAGFRKGCRGKFGEQQRGDNHYVDVELPSSPDMDTSNAAIHT